MFIQNKTKGISGKLTQNYTNDTKSVKKKPK